VDQVTKRTGGRNARVRERVLAAVRAAVESGDPDALSVERLSESSGVHRATIYRRWLSPAGLLADLLRGLTPVRPPLPDTGDLSADLAAVVERVAATLASGFATTTLRMVAARDDHELAAAATAYWTSVLDHVAEVVRRAQRSGQATGDIDAVEAVESLLGPLYLRLLVTGAPINPDDLRRLADRTARMLRPVSHGEV
jgi:AcrR family transcriptional regulator